ncbi:hypothetical protein [Yaravirus sp. 'brasiliensis']|uniref:Uncharacterized protein n=1 Tax=Yaravirus sp. 'brasiliensis' TaxID=2739681 RepID=A0AAE7B4F0_9VIRU|nr:hypothetical protein QKS73_gp27 [Yaravirus brasiliensis]QKE44400.1 hypothetical protein [Yaravirus brasiliensis]
MEVIYSALWTGATLSVVAVAADAVGITGLFWDGKMPGSAKQWAVAIGGPALGYYWYGVPGAIGGIAGAYGALWGQFAIAGLLYGSFKPN